ncbi:hypothetical protein RvY_00552-1 [Ramazzottius varieornatus]|uniref:UBR-type domain-containing protein n=1 Tax=Ramazzottius varieornatus TaxID=947166 RepID=A0A1D1UD69_RAMVA|nr:hypothetical protein RvY_00552-1 [Ramazzottius varieornatus]
MSEHNLPSTSTSPQPMSTSLINFPSSSTAPQVDLTRTDNADNKRTLEDAFSNEEASSAKSSLRNATTLNSSEIPEDQPQNSDDKVRLIADEKPAEEESLAKEESTEGSNHSSVEVDVPIIVLSATAGQEVRSDDDNTGNVRVVLMTVEAFTTYHHASPDDVPTLPVSDEENSVKPVMEQANSGEEEKPVEQTTPTVEFPPEQEEQPAEVAEVAEEARTVDLEAGNGDGGVVENGETRVDEALEGPQGDHQEGPIVTEPVVDEIEATEPVIQTIEITTVTLAPGELTLDGKDVELSALKTAFPAPFIRLVQQHPKLAHMVENPTHGYRHIHGHGHGRGGELAEVPSTGSVMSGVSDAPTATTVDESGSAESLVKSDHEDQQNDELSDDVNMKALAELIDSSTRNCSYSQGYVKRQLVYACRTCILDVMDPAGMCLACALNCHEDHDIVPMLTRRSVLESRLVVLIWWCFFIIILVFDVRSRQNFLELFCCRNFRCDCGNSKFGPRKCQLIPDKDRENSMNVYNDVIDANSFSKA